MSAMLKGLAMAVVAFVSFYGGYFYSNFHWHQEYEKEMLEILNANSIEYSVIYMEKYLAGDFAGAHNWIRDRSLQDPAWQTGSNETLDIVFFALRDLPALTGGPRNRLARSGLSENYVQRIRARQAKLELQNQTIGELAQ